MGRRKGVLEIQIDNDIIDLKLKRILDFNDAIYSHRPQKKVLDYDKECDSIIFSRWNPKESSSSGMVC